MQNRSDALRQIQTLVSENAITKEEYLSLLRFTVDPETVPTDSSGGLLQKLMAYIGGALIFMGLCTYFGMNWDDLTPASRVIVTLGSGVVAFILGLFCLSDKNYARAATPLFIVSSFLETGGMFVFMDEYLPHSGDILKAVVVAFGLMTAQFFTAFMVAKRTSLLFFSILFYGFLLSALVEWLGLYSNYSYIGLGCAGIFIAYGASRSEFRAIAPFYYFWAATTLSAALFEFVSGSFLDVLLIGEATLLIYISTLVASRTLLTVGVISLLLYLGYFTEEYFADVVGWPIAMIVMGFIMIGVSAFAVKLGKKISKTA